MAAGAGAEAEYIVVAVAQAVAGGLPNCQAIAHTLRCTCKAALASVTGCLFVPPKEAASQAVPSSDKSIART